MKKLTAIFISALLLAALALAQTAPKKKPGAPATSQKKTDAAPANASGNLPSKMQIEVAMARSFGYDPAVTWQIYDIEESRIPGMADVLVSMNKQAPVHLYVSADGQNAIVGELMPFGANPFAPARQKLKAADGPARGPQTPVISMIEFSDLQCPHCKAAQPLLEKLAADFPQMRYVFQQFPLPANVHPWAMKAALYADCAGRMNPDAFWKYIDSIFENQGGIALATADEKLKELAAGAGLDGEKVSACAATPETAARVNKSLDLGKSLDVNSTPTVFINGRRVVGPANIPYDQLKGLVQFEIDHAGK
jgi:protein-disulfide isomerase